MKVEKTFCTTREAATLLGVSVGTTQLWVDNGLLSAWKTPGGHRRVARDSVEKLLYVRMQSVVSAPTEAESARMRVLVVEDEMTVAMLIEDTVSELAYEVAAVLPRVEDAMRLLDSDSFDLAMLDVHLNGKTVFPFAA